MQPSRIANETNPVTLTRSTLDFTIWCPHMAVRSCWAGPGSPPFQVPRAPRALARAKHVDGARPTPQSQTGTLSQKERLRLWLDENGLRPVPEARGFGRGWHSLLGGLVDTAAVGRTPPSHTKLPFSEDPHSPGLALVGGADSTGMCRNVPSQERGVGGRLRQVPNPHCLACRLCAASSRKLARNLPAPQLRSCGPSQAPASAASTHCAPERGGRGDCGRNGARSSEFIQSRQPARPQPLPLQNGTTPLLSRAE